ncbi:MAG: hypothetical protein Q8O67_11125 [Deltaproteobacteria bacterium]|nr:hypothetical protein [Deltaproteobacteria bacterium]
MTPAAEWVSHPLSGVGTAALPFAPPSTLGLTARTTLQARYGLTNSLHLALGLEAAPSTGIVSKGVKFENTSGDLFSSVYAEIALPVGVGWRFDSGENVTAVGELQVAPLVAFWGGSALADPNLLDSNGLPSKLPVEIDDLWVPGVQVSARVLVEARIWDWLVLSVGPQAGLSWAGTLGVHAGLVVRPSVIVGTEL